MYESHHLSGLAKLIGDPSRSIMLSLLTDGRSRTASELSLMAGITSQTASSHLAKLLKGKLLIVEKQGRHRYYRLASQDVGDMLESMVVFSQSKIDQKPLGPRDQSLRFARSCYDHLAGELGVRIFDGLKSSGIITQAGDQLVIDEENKKKFTALNINIDELTKLKRPLMLTCLDWSERRHHLAGALGSAIRDNLIKSKWVKRGQKDRVLTLTDKGKSSLESWLPGY